MWGVRILRQCSGVVFMLLEPAPFWTRMITETGDVGKESRRSQNKSWCVCGGKKDAPIRFLALEISLVTLSSIKLHSNKAPTQTRGGSPRVQQVTRKIRMAARINGKTHRHFFTLYCIHTHTHTVVNCSVSVTDLISHYVHVD